MPHTPPTPVPLPGILSWLVGLFALWQFAFIPIGNLFDFVPLRQGPNDINPDMDCNQTWGQFTENEPLQRSAEIIGDGLAFWSEATGQDQGWSMFTPGFPPHTQLPVVELHFPDGSTDRVLSRFEPTDLAHPGSRPPLIDDRTFNFEVQITIAAWYCDEESLAARPDYWCKLPELVRLHERRYMRWLAWQVKQYQASHPENPEPVEVVLIHRYIPTPRPNEARGWDHKPAYERPFARWFPSQPLAPGYLSLEGYDPVAKQWVRLKEGSAP